MNQNSTIEKMKHLRLFGMAETYYQSLQDHLYQDYTLDQFTALLVDQEWEERQNRRIKSLVKQASFRSQISSHDIDYTTNRNLDKNQFERLLGLNFLKQAENIIFTGPTGVGKSHLAQAIGIAACQMLYKVQYYNTTRLMEDVKIAKLDGTYIKLLKRIQKMDLLVLDDFGLMPFDQYARQALMDILEDRYGKTSTIVVSQIPVAQWHGTIGEGTIADAILDRLVHASHRISLEGESLRKKKKLKG
jgi:DNA replication protein DnaC